MSSIRELIVAKIADLAAVNGLTVYRWRTTALHTSAGPSANIKWANGTVQYLPNGVAERELDIKISISMTGENPDKLADRYVVAVHAAIMADIRLGGLAVNVEEQPEDPEIDDSGDGDAYVETLGYKVTYRTKVSDLSTIG